MSDLEKVSINVGAMDLAKIDLLVENSFYKDRTDFVRTAIRNQIGTHAAYVDEAIKNYEAQEDDGLNIKVVVGTERINSEYLTNVLFKKVGKLRLFIIGSLTFEDDVQLDLAMKSIHSIKVLGIFNAPLEIKKHFKK